MRKKFVCDWNCEACKMPDCMRSGIDIIRHDEFVANIGTPVGHRGGRKPKYMHLTEEELRQMIKDEPDMKIKKRYYTAIQRIRLKQEVENG